MGEYDIYTFQLFLFLLHRSLQYLTSPQHSFHFFLQEKGRLQIKQILDGRLLFFILKIEVIQLL